MKTFKELTQGFIPAMLLILILATIAIALTC